MSWNHVPGLPWTASIQERGLPDRTAARPSSVDVLWFWSTWRGLDTNQQFSTFQHVEKSWKILDIRRWPNQGKVLHRQVHGSYQEKRSRRGELTYHLYIEININCCIKILLRFLLGCAKKCLEILTRNIFQVLLKDCIPICKKLRKVSLNIFCISIVFLSS